MTEYKVTCIGIDGQKRDVSTVSVGSQRIFIETYATYALAEIVMRQMEIEYGGIGCKYFVEVV